MFPWKGNSRVVLNRQRTEGQFCNRPVTRLVLPDMDIRNNGDGWNGFESPRDSSDPDDLQTTRTVFAHWCRKLNSFPAAVGNEATKRP